MLQPYIINITIKEADESFVLHHAQNFDKDDIVEVTVYTDALKMTLLFFLTRGIVIFLVYLILITIFLSLKMIILGKIRKKCLIFLIADVKDKKKKLFTETNPATAY